MYRSCASCKPVDHITCQFERKQKSTGADMLKSSNNLHTLTQTQSWSSIQHLHDSSENTGRWSPRKLTVAFAFAWVLSNTASSHNLGERNFFSLLLSRKEKSITHCHCGVRTTMLQGSSTSVQASMFYFFLPNSGTGKR